MNNTKLTNSLIYVLVAFDSYNLMGIVLFVSQIRIMLMELALSFLRRFTLSKRELLLF